MNATARPPSWQYNDSDMTFSSADLDVNPAKPGRSLYAEVERVLNLIRPAVQSDGGDVELAAVSDQGLVELRFHGACVGCPEMEVTLRSLIERTLKQQVPGVTAVQAVS